MELEEIETQLRQSQYVREAIVVPVYKNGKVVHLIGAVVPYDRVEDNLEITTNIKHELKSRLPEYMIRESSNGWKNYHLLQMVN